MKELFSGRIQAALENQAKRDLNEEILSGRVASILSAIGLPEDDLRGKSVLDVGAGPRDVAAYCLKHDITTEVYSLEPNLQNPAYWKNKNNVNEMFPDIIPALNEKTVSGDRSHLPFADNSFDILINHAALPNNGKPLAEGRNDEVESHLRQILSEVIRVLKPGGKAYLFPVRKEIQEPLMGLEKACIQKVIVEFLNAGYAVSTEDIPKEKAGPKSGQKLSYTLSRVIITKAMK